MFREPAISPPPHPFEDVDVVDFECLDCGAEGAALVDSLTIDGVEVVCPLCGEYVAVRLV